MTNNQKLKAAAGSIFLIILVSNFWTMRNWTERTGVYDDLCYLRQAHLFERFGLGGFDTDIRLDDDQYFSTIAKEIGYSGWNDPNLYPCHNKMAATGKTVIQYPPGTGFLLSLFPEGFQRVALYASADLAIFFVALWAVWLSRTWGLIACSTGAGAMALYFMINPAKASFSIAPTFMTCAIVGYLTVKMLTGSSRRSRILATVATGFLLGLAVSFRLPNLILSAGLFIWLSMDALKTRKSNAIWTFVVFGASYLVGIAPTLVSNAINAGGPFSTTYGPSDLVPLDFSFSIAKEYISDLQGGLIIFILALALWTLRSAGRNSVSVVVITNLFCNLIFFLSHPIFTPYYLMPIAMLSLWSLLFNRDSRFYGSTTTTHSAMTVGCNIENAALAPLVGLPVKVDAP